MKGWNRVEDLCCVLCGTALIDPANAQLSMCTECFKKAKEASKKQISNMNNRKGMVKRGTIKIDPRLLHPKFQK